MSGRSPLLLGSLAVAMMVGGGVGAWFVLAGNAATHRSGAERLLEDNFYAPSIQLYHVADFQSRPAVQGVLQRLRAAGFCEFIFKMRTSKTLSNETYLKTCTAAAAHDGRWWHDRELGFSEFDLWSPPGRARTQFAVLTDEHDQTYVFALGKNGTLGADELEALVVGVIDEALKRAPQAIEAQRARATEAARREAERAAGQQRANETFR